MDYAQRRAKLRHFDDVDAIVLVPGANLHYYTGLDYHLSERPIIAIITGEAISFIVPELEATRLTRLPDLEARTFAWSDTDGYEGAFRSAIEQLGLSGKTLGVDDQTMRLFEWLTFEQIDPSLRLKRLGKPLLGIRATKEEVEIAAMREAIGLTEGALQRVLDWVQPGMTERQIATRLNDELNALGTQGFAFNTLVQVGQNSAFPHGNISDTPLGENDFLLIDFGGMMDDYPADITRTVCLGTPSEEMQRIHQTVLAANRAAVAAIKPGVTCEAVDRAARSVIEAAGYGAYFTHRTGHGLGLETHELPQIASGVQDILEPGMVFTVEPGIYVPGVGGVRIEDNVVVTADGVEVLTSFPRELMRQPVV